LTRQNLTTSLLSKWSDVRRGGYVISDQDDIEGILIATGSEVGLALEVQAELAKENIAVRVVSMPSVEVFERQTKQYRDSVLPPSITKRLAIEMGATGMWYKYASQVHGIDTFGVSAPGDEAIQHFGFDVKTIVKRYRSL
jgi:transketolase